MLIEMRDWHDDYMVLESSLPRDRLIRKLESVKAKGNSWYVWKGEGRYLGWVIVHWHGKRTAPDYPDMMKLFVREDFRRKGVASKLVRACEQEALARGFLKMGLSVAESNTPAMALYRRLGYSTEGRPAYPLGPRGTMVVGMVRSLKNTPRIIEA